jgi:hypothetical protein
VPVGLSFCVAPLHPRCFGRDGDCAIPPLLGLSILRAKKAMR